MGPAQSANGFAIEQGGEIWQNVNENNDEHFLFVYFPLIWNFNSSPHWLQNKCKTEWLIL